MKEVVLRAGNQEIKAFISEQDGEQWVAIAPLCEALGINTKKQKLRLQNNPQFKGRYLMVPTFGGDQESICIPVRQVGMWIGNINANRVKPDAKAGLLNLQEHLQDALYHYLNGTLTPELVRGLYTEIASLKQQLASRDIRDAERDARESRRDKLIAHLTSSYLENEVSKRLEKEMLSHAGSMMSNTRWTKRDRERAKERIKQEMMN